MSGSLAVFTAFHVVVSVFGLAFGLLAVLRLFDVSIGPVWTGLFLVCAGLTTVTGFMFPFVGVTPAFVTGIVAGLVLAAVLAAHFLGRWRGVYAAGMVASLYFLVFVTVAQIFNKTLVINDAGQAVAGLAFAGSELVVLAVFVVIGIRAVKRT